MKTTTFILFSLFCISCYSQKTNISDIISKFEGKEGITTVNLTRDAMKLAASFSSNDSGLSKLVNGISSIKILILEKATQDQIESFESMIKKLPLNDYQNLMTVNEGNKVFKMYIREQAGKISDFLLFSTGKNKPLLIDITGKIDLERLSDLKNTMNIQGLEHLSKLDKK